MYLWPGRDGTGIKAGPTVAGILRLAGFKDMKTKVREGGWVEGGGRGMEGNGKIARTGI